MSELRGKYKIRIMKPDEVGRVNDLVIALHNHQNMANVPRVPTKGDARRELLYEDAVTGELKSNNKRTFVVVACDMSKENDPDHKDVIGYLIYGQSFSIMRGRGFWLTSFFIEEEYRSHGLGKKMINFIKLHALKSGSPTLDVGYMNANIAGQRFYARFGSRNVNEDYQMMMIQFADAQ